MKRISTVLLLIVLTAATAVAQEYKAFRVGVGLGYANAIVVREPKVAFFGP